MDIPHPGVRRYQSYRTATSRRETEFFQYHARDRYFLPAISVGVYEAGTKQNPASWRLA